MAHSYSICAECREVNKPCCDGPKIVTGSRWSAPRKTNDKAWAKIAAGNIWWNQRRLDKGSRYKLTYYGSRHMMPPYAMINGEYVGVKITNVGKRR